VSLDQHQGHRLLGCLLLQLTGTIPPELLLVDLQELDLSFNSLTGSLPLLSGTLRVLRLRNNSLSGQLPAQLGNWGMSELDFSNNRWAGVAGSLHAPYT
jgi:hypothetical protein